MLNRRKIVVFMVVFFACASVVFAHGWKAPKNEADKKNPLIATPENILSGKNLYLDLCSICHGEDALGAGEMGHNPAVPPNLLKRLKEHSEGDFFWKIKTGRNDMPSFKEDLDDQEIWQILLFLNNLLHKD